MPHPSIPSSSSTSAGGPELISYTYHGPAGVDRHRSDATTTTTPIVRTLNRNTQQQPHMQQQQDRLSSRRRQQPYASPIRPSTVSSRALAHLYDSGDGTPTQSPAPRTPPCYPTAAVAGHAELRFPQQSSERMQSTAAGAAAVARPTSTTQWWGERYAPPTSSPPPRSASPADLLSSSGTCWLCEGRCLTGPGTTWDHAPALFFHTPQAAALTHVLPVSTLTLCTACAAAATTDPQASSREVLQRCQRTPAIRYRTSAFVNAVREYALLLTLMAEKVVRACERVRRIHGSSNGNGVTNGGLHGGDAAVCSDPAVASTQAPLFLFPYRLQDKVLRQVLAALEELLQRDGRATQLAAQALTPSKGARQNGVSYSEIMAPRERHVLLEEVAHIERQVRAVYAAMKAEEEEEEAWATEQERAAADALVPPPPSQTHASNRGTSRTALRGSGHVEYEDYVVVSPRPSPARETASTRLVDLPRSYMRSRRDAPHNAHYDASPLSLLADPRRAQRQRASPSAAAQRDVRGPAQQRGRHSRHGSSDESDGERSPPALTSPQRHPSRGGGNPHADHHTRTQPAQPAPFPLAPAQHRDRSRSGSPGNTAAGRERREEEEVETQAGERRSAPTHPPHTAQSWGSHTQAQGQQRQQPAATSPGRRTMGAMMGSAMWAAHRGVRREDDDNDKDGAGETLAPTRSHSGEEGEEGIGMSVAAASTAADPENILLNYFAGRTATVPAFRVSATHHRSPRRGQTRGAGDREGRLVDLANGDAVVRGGDDEVQQLQARAVQERRRRHEAEEALLTAHTRIAALEQTTNDMAADLLAHRLSITFGAHLEGMSLLASRVTLLGQSYCLQKSLLFAEEAAAVVRAVQRDVYGVSAFAPGRFGGDARSRVATLPAPPAEEDIGEELWVGDADDDGLHNADGAHPDANGRPLTAHRRGGSELSLIPQTVTSSQSVPAAEVTSSSSALGPFVFPAELRLKPLSLHL